MGWSRQRCRGARCGKETRTEVDCEHGDLTRTIDLALNACAWRRIVQQTFARCIAGSNDNHQNWQWHPNSLGPHSNRSVRASNCTWEPCSSGQCPLAQVGATDRHDSPRVTSPAGVRSCASRPGLGRCDEDQKPCGLDWRSPVRRPAVYPGNRIRDRPYAMVPAPQRQRSRSIFEDGLQQSSCCPLVQCPSGQLRRPSVLSNVRQVPKQTAIGTVTGLDWSPPQSHRGGKLAAPLLIKGAGAASLADGLAAPPPGLDRRHGAALELPSPLSASSCAYDVGYAAAISLLSLFRMIAGDENPGIGSSRCLKDGQAGMPGNFHRVREGALRLPERPAGEDARGRLALIPMNPSETMLHEEVCCLGRKVQPPLSEAGGRNDADPRRGSGKSGKPGPIGRFPRSVRLLSARFRFLPRDARRYCRRPIRPAHRCRSAD